MPSRKPLPLRPVPYVLASLFLIWHTLALVIGPAPGSELMSKIYPAFVPYLNGFNLNNQWGFFAPDPHAGSLLRYGLETRDGERQVFHLTENLGREDADFLRYTSLYLTLIRQPQSYMKAAAKYLCRRHRALKPLAIQFFAGHQLRIGPEQFVAGSRPLQDDYMSVEYFEPIACAADTVFTGEGGA